MLKLFTVIIITTYGMYYFPIFRDELKLQWSLFSRPSTIPYNEILIVYYIYIFHKIEYFPRKADAEPFI